MLKFIVFIFVLIFGIGIAQGAKVEAKVRSSSSEPAVHLQEERMVRLGDASFAMIAPSQEIKGDLVLEARSADLPKMRLGAQLVSGVVEVTAETSGQERLEKMPLLRLRIAPVGSGEIVVHFWNAGGKTWKGLPTQRDGEEVVAPLPVNHTLVAAFEFPVPIAEINKTVADRKAGIQAATDGRDFAISLPADAEAYSDLNIQIRTDAECAAPTPDGMQRTSPIFRIDLRAPDLKAHPYVDLRMRSSIAEFVSQIYRCDEKRLVWRPLPTVWESETVLRAAFEQRAATVAAFSDFSIRSSGVASWYKSSRISMGAASNDYPMNTRLSVTNTKNGKSAIVRVVSSGPFVPDRIIDLTLDAFNSIAHPYRDGVAAVRVQPVVSA